MNHIGLFEGIGGASLAASWMGWETIAWCEKNSYCQKILQKHFPNAKGHGDITTTDFTIYRGKCDIVTGGFPCQPFSRAGKRRGTEDDRFLWKEMLRAIREIQPVWVLGENVPGIVNWSKGLVFEQVQADMEAAGFETFPAINLPACSVDAPHTRERIWFIAHSIDNGHRNIEGQNGETDSISGIGRETIRAGKFDGADPVDDAPNTDSDQRCEGGMYAARPETSVRHLSPRDPRLDEWDTWNHFPTQPPLCRRSDGISHRLDRVRGLGNAWVPQAAYQIFQAIQQYENLKK